VSVLAALRAYGAHPDPTARIANTVALLVGFNGPFYPVYVWLLQPEAGPASIATMVLSPAFLAIPLLSRRWPVVARAALPIVGLLNTVWTAALLGPATGVGAFALPCIVLAGLCWREPRLMLGLLGLGLMAQQVVLHMPIEALAGLSGASQSGLVSLNVMSVGALLAFMMISSARELRALHGRPQERGA
jgi:hypothetical protein